jgi:hypothetical protein
MKGVHEGQDLCHDDIDGRRDLLMEIELGKHLHQGWVFVNRDAVIPGQLNDLLRNLSRSLRADLGGLIPIGSILIFSK